MRRHAHTAILSAVLLAGFAPASASADPRPCANADALPGQARADDLADATRCLVNDERKRRGLGVLRPDRRLARAGEGHARDMVRHRYFGHNSQTGGSFVMRIERSGYLRGARSWRVGENLAWGTGGLSTPRAVVRSWMSSAGHRANILHRRYRELGAAVVFEAPVDGTFAVAATYTHEFGARGG